MPFVYFLFIIYNNLLQKINKIFELFWNEKNIEMMKKFFIIITYLNHL